jgi:hypothetical protein
MNPLMSSIGPMNNMRQMMQMVNGIKQMMNGKNPDTVMKLFAQKNQQFAQFLRDNQGKSPQQIAQDYGLDWNMVQGFLK